MAEVFRIFSDKIEAKMASIFERAIKDENDSLSAAIKRLQHNRIETERFGSNKSFYIGEGFARGRRDNTLDRMRKFYEREEKIESLFARHFSMMSDRRGLRNANTSATRDETWMYQLGLKKSDASSNFSYLADQEKDQRDFDSKLEAARVKGIIEAQKKRQAGFDRGHNAEVRARLGQMHDAKAFRYAMMDTDERNIRTLMDSHRSWNRGQAEQVYFHQLTENTKWLRLIGKNNPKIAKSLIPIAKTIGKASGLPIVGAFASNPALAAITAAIGGFSSTISSSNAANEATKKWRNYESLYGKPTAQQEWNARLAGIKDPAKIAEIYGQLAVNFGGDPDMFLLSQGIALRGMDHKQKQLHAKAFGFTPEMVRLAEIYAGATPEESDIVDARIYALEREESEGWKSGSGFRKTLRSMQLKWIPFQKDLEARGWSWGKILALANPLMFGGQFVGNEIGNAVWDEVHDTAEIDDRYRAGMYDNSVTNNDASRSVSLQVNVASPQITTTGDPVDFAKSISLIGSRALSEYQSIIENTDTKRKQ